VWYRRVLGAQFVKKANACLAQPCEQAAASLFSVPTLEKVDHRSFAILYTLSTDYSMMDSQDAEFNF
jgi:hypothetical protein